MFVNFRKKNLSLFVAASENNNNKNKNWMSHKNKKKVLARDFLIIAF